MVQVVPQMVPWEVLFSDRVVRMISLPSRVTVTAVLAGRVGAPRFKPTSVPFSIRAQKAVELGSEKVQLKLGELNS